VRYLLLAIALTGCWPDEDVVLFDERFEGGWAGRWVGAVGSVGSTETVHPGEHGAFFYTTATITAPAGITIYDEYSDGLWLEYSSTCAGAPLVTMLGQTLWLDLPVAAEDLRADGGWGRVHLNVPARVGDTILSLSVATAGTPSDACVIDNLRIFEPAVDYAF
jgi:hypothetical protein